MAEQLTDQCCTKLIKKAYSHVNGLQDTQASRTALPDDDFVQILHVNNSHWLTISTINCFPGRVNIYDSLVDKNVTLDTKVQIARLLHIHCQRSPCTSWTFTIEEWKWLQALRYCYNTAWSCVQAMTHHSFMAQRKDVTTLGKVPNEAEIEILPREWEGDWRRTIYTHNRKKQSYTALANSLSTARKKWFCTAHVGSGIIKGAKASPTQH